MRTPARRALAVGLASCLALSACGGKDDATTPAVTTTATVPTDASSASATSTPSPTPSAKPNPSEDSLYLEAVGVYKAYFAEMQKFEAAQYPTRTLPKSMDQYITGEMKSDVEGSIQSAIDEGLAPAPGAHSVLSAIGPNPGVYRAGSLVSIRICSDGRAGRVVRKRTGVDLGPGTLAYKEIFFIRVGRLLKGFVQDSQPVSTCPIK